MLGLLQAEQCRAPGCCCPHGILFVWHERKSSLVRVCWELRSRDGRRFEGAAKDDADAARFGLATAEEHGLQRMRQVHGRPVEVARA